MIDRHRKESQEGRRLGERILWWWLAVAERNEGMDLVVCPGNMISLAMRSAENCSCRRMMTLLHINIQQGVGVETKTWIGLDNQSLHFCSYLLLVPIPIKGLFLQEG
ncbi:hypothetical protein HanRHA438_Chr03g0134101 [Helianthus annuus]|uniref:Uncharacterized protein n=1 Tax=Helianthus annuus TaxID=4232 RepID=A0A9K3JH58_HELAN|nr:hypothetical protein HanXRQr2_Chr03g0122141 [Helianthus annuus]KAJ0936703.1 hypothetical protein HanRHA438_Chr03g0134101 [Helianthus annuus]